MGNVVAQQISTDGLKQSLTLLPRFDPLGAPAKQLTELLWKGFDEFKTQANFVASNGEVYKFEANHVSLIGAVLEAEGKYKAAAPIILPVIAVTVGVLFGVLFSSVGVTIKVMLTVILPLCATYGMIAGIYQFGWLTWLGIPKVEHGVFWRLYFTGMSFLFSLAVDYDMFLFARVYEYRHSGYDNTSAVIKALQDTGPVIITAGTLMILSFICLAKTDQLMMQQTSLLYLLGLILDTYIVRVFIAPAALCIGDWANYWPGKVPKPTKSFEDDENGSTQDASLQQGVREAMATPREEAVAVSKEVQIQGCRSQTLNPECTPEESSSNVLNGECCV